MAWLDDKPIVMPPDLIMFILDDGEPITNAELREGIKVNVVVAKALDIWRTPRGLELSGSKSLRLRLRLCTGRQSLLRDMVCTTLRESHWETH